MKTRRLFWQVVFAINILATGIALTFILRVAIALGVALLHSKWTVLIAGCGVLLIASLAALIMAFHVQTDWLEQRFDRFAAARLIPRVSAGVLLAIVLVAYPFAVFSSTWGSYFTPILLRLSILWWLAVVASGCLKLLWKEMDWLGALLLAILGIASVFSLAMNFSNVTDYPFSLGWSEASRYYSASLFFAERFYNMSLPLAIWNPSLNFLLALPFLFGEMPVWGLRAWWAILQTGATLALSAAFVRRLYFPARQNAIAVFLWGLLFLAQQTIYVQLLLCAFIVVWGVKSEKFWRTLLIVLGASIWAGLSRVNWFPVPGLLAAVVYLLETPIENSKHKIDYLLKPVILFTAGLLTALASNLLYMYWSGNGIGMNFASSLGADLLWYRLFPSATNQTGVLPAALLVSAPVWLIIFLALEKIRIHPMRWGGILTALLVLWVGGIIVSTKIGGGADLHNLDAYLILLMLLGGYSLSGRITLERSEHAPDFFQHPWVYLPALLLPLGLILQMGHPMVPWDRVQATQTLEIIHSQAEQAAAQGRTVLFITQRHLLTFKEVNVPLVPDYEVEYLTEMILSHNQAYLDRFQADIHAQRFGLIVVFPLEIRYKGSTFPFGEEDDAWVREIARPVLCYYERIYRSPNYELDLLVPRAKPCQ